MAGSPHVHVIVDRDCLVLGGLLGRLGLGTDAFEFGWGGLKMGFQEFVDNLK